MIHLSAAKVILLIASLSVVVGTSQGQTFNEYRGEKDPPQPFLLREECIASYMEWKTSKLREEVIRLQRVTLKLEEMKSAVEEAINEYKKASADQNPELLIHAIETEAALRSYRAQGGSEEDFDAAQEAYVRLVTGQLMKKEGQQPCPPQPRPSAR